MNPEKVRMYMRRKKKLRAQGIEPNKITEWLNWNVPGITFLIVVALLIAFIIKTAMLLPSH